MTRTVLPVRRGLLRRRLRRPQLPLQTAQPRGLHLVKGDEAKRRGVDAEPLSAPLRRTVLEDVSEVGVGARAPNLDAIHPVGRVAPQGHRLRRDALGKGGPTAAGVELVLGGKQGLPAHDVHVDALLEEMAVLPAEGHLRRGVLGDVPGQVPGPDLVDALEPRFRREIVTDILFHCQVADAFLRRLPYRLTFSKRLSVSVSFNLSFTLA